MKNIPKDSAPSRIGWLLFVIGLACALLILTALSVVAQPETPPQATIGINGPPPPVLAGTEISVTIRIEDIVGLYGAEINLSFVPEDLQVVDTDVTPAECPAPDFVVSNTVDNVNGTILYVVVQLNPTQPFDGSCDVAHITFETLRIADTTVSFGEVILSDVDGQSIPATPVDWNVSITRLGEVRGMKYLDLDKDGTKDAGEPGLQSWDVHLFNTGLTVSETATTGVDGNYSFTVPVGDYYVCEIQETGWSQSGPATGPDCSQFDAAHSVTHGPVGYNVAVVAEQVVQGKDFGNRPNLAFVYLPEVIK